MILNKEILGGERIPEEQIAKYFEVSRTPIREALRNLEKYGLVRIVPRHYAEVVKLQADATERLGILKLRIDSLAVGLCVDNATDADCDLLESMAKLIIERAESRDLASVNENDSAFHLKLAELSGNPFLYQIEQLLDVNVQLLRTTVYTSDEQVAEGLKLHLPLVEAIRKRDKEAAVGLIQQHLRDFYLPGK
jgi:DNA-binding GntR family transcriptional regulator